MNSESHIIRFLLLSLAAGIIAGQTSTPQDSQDLSQRDLRIQRLPSQAKTAGPLAIPRGYALVIGIGKYQKLDPSDYLKFSESDADAIYRVLISQQGGQFPSQNVHKLIGPQATLRNLKRELEEWLPGVAREPDRVVVYFAGHGFVKGGRGYIAPWDVDPSSPETTAYPMNMLGEVLAEKVKAQWKVLLTDACHSGRITAETNDAAVNSQLSQLPNGFLNLSATGAREASYEDPRLSTGFGIFTYFVVRAFQGSADNNCDGVITAEEFVDYVRRWVSSYATERGASQTPTDHERDYDNNMILGVNPTCLNAASPPPAPQGSLVIEANMDDVKVYLDDKLEGTVGKGNPLTLPGLAMGVHTVKGVRQGYEPDTKQVMIVPGQKQTVTLRIQYRLEAKPSALELLDHGEKLLYKRTSGFNPVAAFNPIGLYKPNQQTLSDLKRARQFFEEALREDPNYPKAAFDLALACQQLGDYNAMLEAFRRAVQLDPSYVDARVQYAGALIEEGDPDEAIRQLTEAIRTEPKNDVAVSHISRAYLDKGIWDLAVESADKAISLDPESYEPYLWRADALRHQAADQKDLSRRPAIYARAVQSYRTFLELTNFTSPVHERLASYFIGFGLGYRSHADRRISYAYQRSLAFMGLCECEEKLGNLLRASEYCQRATSYDPNEPMAYFLLANVYRDMFNNDNRPAYLVSARANYKKMIQINPDLELSRHARDYIEQIDQLLHQLN